MMSDKLRISSEEREIIVRGTREEYPKYVSQILNLANQNAQATRAEYVGKMKDILREFDSTHPEGTYDDWVDFYMSGYNGDEKISNSAERLYDMVEKMRKAMQEIDEEDAERYVSQLVLYKTYMGNDIDEVIARKLEQVYSREVQLKPKDWVVGYIDDIPFVLQSLDDGVKTKSPENAVTVYYRVESDNSIVIDSHELSQKLGLTIAEDEETYRTIDQF